MYLPVNVYVYNDTEILPEVINVGCHTIDQVAAAAAAAAKRTCIKQEDEHDSGSPHTPSMEEDTLKHK